jgi:hypothetical protein
VIAGEIGSGPFGYTAVGEQVGMAQRMESVAPPGGVMVSASTARLVEGAAALGEPELVQIKGADGPVPARRLLRMGDGHRAVRRLASATNWPSEISDDAVGYFATAIDFPSIGDTSSEKGRSKNEREL